MLFRYSYAAKVGAKHKSLCYRYVIFRLTFKKIFNLLSIMLHLNISIHCSKQSITPPKSLCCAITTLTIGQIIDNYIRFVPPIHSSKDNSLTFSFCFHIISISNVTFVRVKVKLSTPSNFSLSQCFLLIMQRIYINVSSI